MLRLSLVVYRWKHSPQCIDQGRDFDTHHYLTSKMAASIEEGAFSVHYSSGKDCFRKRSCPFLKSLREFEIRLSTVCFIEREVLLS